MIRCSPSSCSRYFDTEAIPTLQPVPGIDLHDYSRTLIERFANPVCATPSPGCAPTRRTASRNGCSR